ncbi:NAD(P)H-dependent oxidoreductase subunit E [Azospirillum sp. sgz301742]
MSDTPASRHPGAVRRSASPLTKGRPVDARALAEVRAVLGGEPRRRDLLIEHLHRIQDAFGALSAAHLAALAEEMRLSQAEVHEVATFYAHFDVVREGEPAPPPVTVRVCDGLTCSLAGAEDLHAELTRRMAPARVRVAPAPCMGRCDTGPSVLVGRRPVDHATPDSVAAAVAAGRIEPDVPAYQDFDAYTAGGGYRLLRDALDGRATPEDYIARLDGAGLRGLGGAGFPAGRKWRFLRERPAPRLMAVNADEGEPGTFKDRRLLEGSPHQMLEGMLIAAWAIEATDVFLYVRDEYPVIRAILAREIARLSAEGLDRVTRIHLRRGAGAYICGEESAMLESIEGKRGLPRQKPPYPAESGLWGRPTLIHNVETLHWVRPILENGPGWFAGFGRQGRTGQRHYSVSGRVREPGVKLAPAGITVRKLIDEFCDGMADGHTFKAYLPGGASGGILPASMADVPLDFGTLEPHGCFIGSAAVIVLSQEDSLRDTALNLMRFFADESCGQCTPCRAGTEKALALMERPLWDTALLDELGAAMRDASICGLGQAACNPVRSVLRWFADEVT